MKIALTGHNYGFGPYIKASLESLGHHVIGLSRTTGYDLTKYQDRQRSYEASKDCEVYINNSSAGGYQAQILKEWVDVYQYNYFKIINVSSNLSHIKAPAQICELEWKNKTSLVEQHIKVKNSNTNCQSNIVSWGYWKNHPFVAEHPELETDTTIEQALKDIIILL